nr:hypothetical protein [Halobacillus litoralis]
MLNERFLRRGIAGSILAVFYGGTAFQFLIVGSLSGVFFEIVAKGKLIPPFAAFIRDDVKVTGSVPRFSFPEKVPLLPFILWHIRTVCFLQGVDEKSVNIQVGETEHHVYHRLCFHAGNSGASNVLDRIILSQTSSYFRLFSSKSFRPYVLVMVKPGDRSEQLDKADRLFASYLILKGDWEFERS